MSGKILGILAVTAALGVLGTASAIAKDDFDKRDERGGFVLPCDLSGVNPVHHPDIFGNPAVARAFGFVQGPDRVWRVRNDCFGGRRY
jgi:hypothetical protein